MAKNHLGEHSKFFMKKPHKYLECVCRVCEGSGSDTLAGSEEKEVELHFPVHHPMENFASEEDVAEVVADNRECYEERSKWDSSMDSDDNQINQEEEPSHLLCLVNDTTSTYDYSGLRNNTHL